MPSLPYQPSVDSSVFAVSGGVMFFGLLVYVYFAYAIMTLSDKTKTPHSWWAWVPILNALQLVKVAGKSYWWILLFFIPLVNLIFMVYVWMLIAERRGFEKWLGVLMIVPFVNFFVPGYLAFAEPGPKKPTVCHYLSSNF